MNDQPPGAPRWVKTSALIAILLVAIVLVALAVMKLTGHDTAGHMGLSGPGPRSATAGLEV